jgi:transcription initiation factor TFIIIB Brf1 subunit/transcription initiation factor TFIIB
MGPQLATPSALSLVVDDGREISTCEHCGAVVVYNSADVRPNWFHERTGGRVCGVPDPEAS